MDLIDCLHYRNWKVLCAKLIKLKSNYVSNKSKTVFSFYKSIRRRGALTNHMRKNIMFLILNWIKYEWLKIIFTYCFSAVGIIVLDSPPPRFHWLSSLENNLLLIRDVRNWNCSKLFMRWNLGIVLLRKCVTTNKWVVIPWTKYLMDTNRASVLWVQIEVWSEGGCNFYIFHFIAFLRFYDVRFVTSQSLN